MSVCLSSQRKDHNNIKNRLGSCFISWSLQGFKLFSYLWNTHLLYNSKKWRTKYWMWVLNPSPPNLKISQGSKGIKQWPMNLCISPNDDKLNYSFCKLQLVVELLNQYSIKVSKVVKPTNKQYKTMGTSIINSPLSTPSLKLPVSWCLGSAVSSLLLTKLGV